LLLEYGNALCDVSWKIDEKVPLKYSRVYYVYDGEVEYADAQLKTCLKPGYLYIFPSTTIYTMKQNIHNRLHCTFMHIDFFPFQLTELIEMPIEKNSALKHILCSIAECINENNTKLINALADVFKLYCTEYRFFKLPDSRITKALIYIADHMKEEITVHKLSSLSGYNVQYFVRLFKKSTGLTPHQYIISYRLKEAKKILKTDISVSEVANMTGFSDIKTFSRSFKQHFSSSPSMYRKSHIIKP
jgi:AraC-like DNA-binding protein